MQETLVRAWRHPEERDAHGNWTRPWLRTVARRIAIDQIRATHVRPPEWPYDPAAVEQRSAAADEIDRLIDRGEVLSALASLNASQRAVLTETYLRERTTVEAAGAIGVPVGTVRSRMFYAPRALRAALLRRGFRPADGVSPAGSSRSGRRPGRGRRTWRAGRCRPGGGRSPRPGCPRPASPAG
ncbi:RNA polymerase sigma-70 factor (ECF subfamily) [Catenuloplanes indicus]|uniref:RNA polymerase sigma-70 factor (ECF subfamily) n=1 Tax=Catenuloplanes indicus TaxID=137267 RepID=A0AAE3VV85_9ACTN|nr:RNA polymerase sigma-70 factor (ECF subfamily) [Catenuloplanes indicus]